MKNKENLFQAFMWISFIGIIVLGIVLSCKSCSAQDKFDIDSLQELNPYENDLEGPLDYDGAILFYPDGVIDFIYHTQDNEYIIEYDDPDAFDIDNMTYNQDGNYYYIEIYCDSTLFFEYLSYYNTLNSKNPAFYEPSDEYFIEEDYLQDGTPYYKLVKYAFKKDL